MREGGEGGGHEVAGSERRLCHGENSVERK